MEDGHGKSIQLVSMGGLGRPCPQPVLSPGSQAAANSTDKRSGFLSGALRSSGSEGSCPPPIIPVPALAAWWEDSIQHATCLANLPSKAPAA